MHFPKIHLWARMWIPFICLLGLSFVIFQEYVRPLVSEYRHGEAYKQLALACDLAMHEEVVLREIDSDDPAMQRLKLSADVGMLVCHDYDLMRKRLLLDGMSEDQLAMLGLEVLEVEQITVQQMVDAHRMDRF